MTLHCQTRLAGRGAAEPLRERFPTGAFLATPWSVFARPLLLICAALLLGAGCNRGHKHGRDTLDVPPNLGGHYTDADGVMRTQADVRDVVTVGGQVAGNLPPRGDLAGFEFEAFRGAEITAEVEVFEQAGPVGVAIYGPRTVTGLWDEALVDTRGDTPGLLSLTTAPLPAAGMYLVLVWTAREQDGPWFELRLSCKGNCGTPACPDMAPCDLVCENGFVPDGSGCRTCACQEPPQCGEGVGECPPGQICGDDGRCREAPPPPPECTEERPVCDTEGQTWPNECSMLRAGRVIDHEGRCRDAPAPECDEAHPCVAPAVCEGGRCVRPECTCPDESAPVCSRAGRTYRNLCEMECHEGADALAYRGECLDLRPCREAADCPEGRLCEAVRDPENQARCRANPDDANCQRVCVMAPPSQRCGHELPDCPQGQACYPEGAEFGLCLPMCRLADAGGCGDAFACGAVDAAGLPEGAGVCLPACRPGAPGNCPPGLACLPDAHGQNVCQVCGCPRPEPGQEVCTDDQVQYPSECFARCAQASNWRPGRCGDDPVCDCPRLWAPVCGPDHTLYNRCEARCELPEGAVVQPPDACLPDGTVLAQACVHDEDCAPAGCEGRLCTAAPLREAVCPPVSDELVCYAEHGRCGCINNRCAFHHTREVERCLQAAGALPPPDEGDGMPEMPPPEP